MSKIEAKEFRQDIQGVRAVAVCAVIAHHLFDYGSGFIGVDIFFVVSGYLIGGLLLREIEQTGRVQLGRFFSARMRRLLPNALLTLVIILVVTLLVVPASEWSMITSNVLAAALYYANFAFADQSLGYFHPHLKDNPVVHFWSLSIEEQFYLGLALLFSVAAFAGRISRLWTMGSVYAVTILSFALALMADPDQSQSNFFLSQYRFWEFGIGIIAAAHERQMRHWPRAVLVVLAYLATLVWVACFFLPQQTYPWPGIATLLPTISTAFLLVTLSTRHPVHAVLANKLAQAIGDRSYSLYLWHWPSMVFVGYLFGKNLLHGILALVITLLLSEAAWRWVETPFRTKTTLGWRPAAVGLASCFSVAALASLVMSGSSVIAPKKVERGRLLSENTASRSAVNTAGCFSSVGRWADYETCAFGAPGSDRRIVLWGDSHAMSWFDGIDPAAKALDFRLEVSLMQACPPILHPRYYHFVKGVYSDCLLFAETALQRILGNPPDIVILGSAPRYDVLVGADGNILAESAGRQAEQHALSTTIRTLRDAGIVVVLAIDPPKVQKRYDTCVSAGHDICTFPFPEENLRNSDRVVAEALGHDIVVADFVDRICPNETCVSFARGTFTYRDNTHLNPEFSAGLAEQWQAVLAEAQTRL